MKENILNIDLDNYEIGKTSVDQVDFPSFYGLQKVTAPLYVHRATKEISPCVVVTACVHGDEINGLRIAQSLIKGKLKIQKGTLIIIPVVNIYGFLNKLRYLPDRKDLNRCFPGLPKGSFGSRFAHFIFQNITKYGDVFIDLHSGPPGRFNIPQIRCDLSNKIVQDLVDNISVPLVVNSSLKDGSLREAIESTGKACIVFEGGEGLRFDETITKYGVNLVKSTLAHLQMIKTKKEFNKDKVIINKTKWLRAKEGGLLINKAHHGKVAKKGDIIGELRKITGELITYIRMDNDGVILGTSKSSLIMSGDALYNIGFLNNEYQEDDEEFMDYFDFDSEE
ncbi:succinylglutamate desuccinylase/aspartoacylase family protein [Halobacteriovorax sp. HLS]|uniref:succinylglutamate desuccinylase/aspartoacylase family protein n=1 Tax=Halobacteriovorax sp. HLS TaxID=2234000 RepID=UPI000FD6E3FA|nr:succinylglutamate desuccinylase/aspartoacylase family protein [Halobacteriovorax sp. HLS]